jgi:predicted acyltransferase
MSENSPRAATQRFLSLDVFRGLCIFLMILVNTPGAGARPYAQLAHTPWLGFTLADLVFPSFLFAMGNALSFAAITRDDDRAFLAKVARRSVLIFLLGFLMYWFPFFHIQVDGSWAWNPLAQTRVMGVLQRIALCYAFAAIAVRYLAVRWIVLLGAALLLGYWAVLYLGSPPGLALDKLGNIGTRLDLLVLGREHLYRKDGGFDPEGLLGTLPAIVNVLAGYLAGCFLRGKGNTPRAAIRLALAGIAALVLALLWNPWFPIAKKLWTSSFVLYTVGWDLVLLAILVQLIEIMGWRRGAAFFTVLGKNPLVIYLLSECLATVLHMIPAGTTNVLDWVGVCLFQRMAPGALGSLLGAIAFTMVCWLVGFVMDRRRIYVRL